MNPIKHTFSWVFLAIISCCFSRGFSAQTQTPSSSLTPELVIELALSSPVFHNEATARLNLASGKLESARRWWMPSTTFGATSFVHSGNALNANGEMFTEVDSRSAELGFALSFNADASRGLSGVKSEKLSYQATLQEVKSDRDAFVLSCMNTFISAVAAKRDFDFHKQALEELLSFEIQYQALADLGLRPQSDALSARTERLQLESLLLTLQANIALVTAELRGALGMSMNPEIESVWPIPDLTIELIATNLPARQALIYRVDEAKANMRGVLEEVWAPELRLNPMYSSFGTEFNSASLAPTNEWVTSLVFSFPIENLLPGGKRKQTAALVDYSEARLSEWDLMHSAYVEGLVERISIMSEALESSEQAVSSADLSLSDVVLRMAHGIVDPVELLSVQRARLNAHSRAISLKEQLLKLEFELISETNPKWN
ncbi:MAG: TolC family protein [Bacteroidetes bacterium]|nr:TolC family protein [Bacteroidota bacterium]MDA0981365.1 TolC family protein [Bacteroidota bacterium]